MRATVKRDCNEDDICDSPLTEGEDETFSNKCSDDTSAVVESVVFVEEDKVPNLTGHSSDGNNNNERENIRNPGNFIVSSEKETPPQIVESKETMLTLNNELIDEPSPGNGCASEANEDTTDLMTAICRVLPELRNLNPLRERRHSFEFQQYPPKETALSNHYCRRGTAPSLLFVLPQIALTPEHDDVPQRNVNDGILDACLAHEISLIEPHPEVKREKLQDDKCSSQIVEDNERTKETVPEKMESINITIENLVASDHTTVGSDSDNESEPGGKDKLFGHETNENEVELNLIDNPVHADVHDTDQDYELEIAVGENQVKDLNETVPHPVKDEAALQTIDREPHYATVCKGLVPVPPEGEKYVNCLVTTGDAQGIVSVSPHVEADNAEHIYDCPKEVKEARITNDESHAPESNLSGVCREETGCGGAPVTSEPIYETIEDGNEKDNNNEGNGPDFGKASSCQTWRRCFCLLLGRLHVLPFLSCLVHLLACRSQW